MADSDPRMVTRAELRAMKPADVLKVNPANIVPDDPRAAERLEQRAQLAKLSPAEILAMHKAGELDHLTKPAPREKPAG